MKKIILCLLVAVILTNCDVSVKPKEAKAEESNVVCSDNGNCVSYRNRVIDGIEYAIFYHGQAGSQSGSQPFVINLTKEKLEIELLHKQLNSK